MAQRKFIIDGGFKTEDASELLANLTMGGTIDMDDNKVIQVATPTDGTDGANKTYADTVAAQAVTDAGTAATNADNALQTSLQTYADTAEADAIATAAADATSKANAAQAAAEATAAGANTALQTAMESYADTAEADAVSTAATDATTKADAAETAANGYTDTAVANLVDSAPGSLDTLNELAAALGDDANYAASVTSAIAAAQTAAQNYADANDANTTYTAGNGMTLSGTEFLMSGNYTGSFTATGDITAYSDDSLKTNVQVIDGALGKVEAIRGVTFERIEDGSVSTGVIAQELKAVLPEAVHTDAEGVHSVAYGNITGLLIEAVKELSAQVEELKAK